jgi:hypothetical protein
MSAGLALLLASSIPSLANPGDCGWVHGRYQVANGSMIHRIWIVGTDHELNLDVADEAKPLQPFLGTSDYDPTVDRLIGEFYVCARERRVPKHMQRVHLERARALRVVK